jgi:hypothetical protein
MNMHGIEIEGHSITHPQHRRCMQGANQTKKIATRGTRKIKPIHVPLWYVFAKMFKCTALVPMCPLNLLSLYAELKTSNDSTSSKSLSATSVPTKTELLQSAPNRTELGIGSIFNVVQELHMSQRAANLASGAGE